MSVPTRPRADVIDWARGLVMVLMALDHTRDFVGDLSIHAVDAVQSNPALYATRWITHLCAPTFLFLTGVGAWLSRGRGRSTASLSLYLFTRGLWMIVLEATIIKIEWSVYTPLYRLKDWNVVGLSVFGALGGGMLLLSLLVWLPRAVSVVFGLAVVFGHSLLNPIEPKDLGDWGWVWRVLHEGGPVKITDDFQFWFAYPWLAWCGVMALGYGVGGVFVQQRQFRRPALALGGAVLLATFAAFRCTNTYGDPKPWKSFDDPIRTAMSIFDCEKYPPSCAYLWATLGIVAVVIALADRPAGPPGKWIITFGRVPQFFYLLHLPTIHLIALVTYLHGQYYGGFAPIDEIMKAGRGLGNSLGTVYVSWLVVLFLLYWPCRWFAGVKARNRNVLLSYL